MAGGGRADGEGRFSDFRILHSDFFIHHHGAIVSKEAAKIITHGTLDRFFWFWSFEIGFGCYLTGWKKVGWVLEGVKKA